MEHNASPTLSAAPMPANASLKMWDAALRCLASELAITLVDFSVGDCFDENGHLDAPALLSSMNEHGVELIESSAKALHGELPTSLCLAHTITGRVVVITGFSENQAILAMPSVDLLDVDEADRHCTAENVLPLSAIKTLWVARVLDPSDQRAKELHAVGQHHWLWQALRGQRAWYRDLIVASVLVNILALVIPLFTMNVYDRVVPNQATETLWVLVSVVLIVLLFDWLLRGARARITDHAGRHIDVTVSARLYEKLLGMELRHRPQSAAVFTKQVQEFDAVRDFLTSATLVALVDLPFSLLFITLILWLGGAMFIVPLLAMVLLGGYAWMLRGRVAQAIESGARFSSQRQAMLLETLQNLPEVKQSGLLSLNRKRWRNLVEALADNAIDSRDAVNALSHAIAVTQNLVTVFLIIFGVYRIAAGDLSMGGLIAVVMLSGRMAGTVNQVAMLLLRGQQMKTALSALDSIMALPQENQNAAHFGAQRFDGNVRLEKATFHWPGTQSAALKDIELTIRPGERIGLCGASGSGKSTLLALLAAQVSPDAGRILFSGVERDLWPQKKLREDIAWCGQSPGLFWGSVLDNITAGRDTLDEKRLLQVLRDAGVDRFLAALENGLQSPVGESGRALSGGQRQAVALARTLLTNANLYLLDEPTSAMDQHMEQQVFAGLARLPKEATLIIATHRPALLALCDRIVVLESGQIKADGKASGMARSAGNADAQSANKNTARRATKVTLRKGNHD